MFHRIVLWVMLAAIIVFLAACGAEHQNQADNSVDRSDTTAVTFNTHIAPIVHANCAPCHRPGEAGPFSLLTFADLKKRTKMIKYVTQSGFMPPWPANPVYRSFANERGLTDEEKALIKRWIDQGAPEGDPKGKPELPRFEERQPLGVPDEVVWMRDTMYITGDNTDHFRYMKVPFELKQDTFLKAIEFVPGNRELLHHMNGNLINYDPAQKSDVFAGVTIVDPDTTDTFSAYHYMQLANDDGSFPPLTPSAVNYLPGVGAVNYPEGIGGYYVSRKGAFLVQSMHYGPTPIDTFDLSRFELYYAEKPPERPLLEIQMGTLGETPVVPAFVIPADTIMTFRTTYRVPRDISVVTINPHMHLLGREFRAFAVPPSGDTIPLIHIPEWDFRWQYFYTFKRMLKIPRGSEITAVATFDNTLGNPFQPFVPTKTIFPPPEGDDMKTTDEMFQFFVNYVPYKPGDEHISLENN